MRALPLVFFLAIPAAVSAGPLACRAPIESNAGPGLFSDPPEITANRCAEQLSGSLAIAGGALECLLLVHDVTGVKPPLDAAAVASLEKVIRDTPLPPSTGLDPPVITRAMEVLIAGAPQAALALARELTAFGARPQQVARGALGLAMLGTDDDLRHFALHFVSRDRALRRVAMGAAARRASPVTNPMIMPVLADPELPLSQAVSEGLARAATPHPGTLHEVLESLPVERLPPYVTALAERAEPRQGRLPIRDAKLAASLEAKALRRCDEESFSRPAYRAALRIGDPLTIEAWELIVDEAAREAPLECEALRREIGLALAESLGNAADRDEREKRAKLLVRYMRAAGRRAFTPLELAIAQATVNRKHPSVARALRDPKRTAEAIEAIRWGGTKSEASELRTFAREVLSTPHPACVSPTLLVDAYVAAFAASQRGP